MLARLSFSSSKGTAVFFETPALALDPLWRLTRACASDTRPERMNLVVGVYRNEHGECPVQYAVHQAETRLAERATSKEYTSPRGNERFNDHLTRLILGSGDSSERATAVQAVGGTGALRLLSELLALTGPDRTVHLGTPAYVNHRAILSAAKLRVHEYPVDNRGEFDADALLDTARKASPGDVILLQGSCHNPTGLSMPLEAWGQLAEIMAQRGVIPFIDHAYFGLGDGIAADLAGMRAMLDVVPEALIAVSASKAWGIYNERTGCAIVVARDQSRAEYAKGILEVIARADYSQAPSHGASVVAEILDDDSLRTQWVEELEQSRARLMRLRDNLIDELEGLGAPAHLTQLRDRRGMFITLPFSESQMESLRTNYAIYGVPSGRINIAATQERQIPYLARAIAEVAGREL